MTLDGSGRTSTSWPSVNHSGAVRVPANISSAVVRKGTIAGHTTVTVCGTFPNLAWTRTQAGFSTGISAHSTTGAVQVERMTVTECRSAGFNLPGAGQCRRVLGGGE